MEKNKIYDLKSFKKYSFENLNLIKEDLNKFNNNISKACESLIQIMDNFIDYLYKIDDTILHDLSELKDNGYYKEFIDIYSLLDDINIRSVHLLENIKEKYNGIINYDFFPVKENTSVYNISSCLEKGNYTSEVPTQKSFYSEHKENEDLNDTNSKNNSYNYKCCKCGNNNAIIISQIKKDLYCKNCYETLKHEIDGKEIDETNKVLADRASFLNSMINLIKFIILECDEIIRIKDDNNSVIKKKVEYYKIENIQDYTNFLVNINKCINGEVNIENFNLANLNKDIRAKISDLFKRNIDIKINLEQEEDDDNNESSAEIRDEFFDANQEQNVEKEKNEEKEKK